MYRLTRITILYCLCCSLALWLSNYARGEEQYEVDYRGIVSNENEALSDRLTACRKLADIGPEARRSGPALAGALLSDRPLGWYVVVAVHAGMDSAQHYGGIRFRLAALKALQAIDADPQTVVPLLVRALQQVPSDYTRFPVDLVAYDHEHPDRERTDRTAVPPWPGTGQKIARQFRDMTVELIETLQGHGPQAREAVDTLVRLVNRELRPTDHPRELSRFVPQPPPHMSNADQWRFEYPWLLRRCQIAAIDALGSIATSQDVNAVDALVDACRTDERLRDAAESALRKIRSRRTQSPHATRDHSRNGVSRQTRHAAAKIDVQGPEQPRKDATTNKYRVLVDAFVYGLPRHSDNMTNQQLMAQLEVIMKKHPDEQIRKRAELAFAVVYGHEIRWQEAKWRGQQRVAKLHKKARECYRWANEQAERAISEYNKNQIRFIKMKSCSDLLRYTDLFQKVTIEELDDWTEISRGYRDYYARLTADYAGMGALALAEECSGYRRFHEEERKEYRWQANERRRIQGHQ